MLALKLDQLSGLTSSRAISIGERIKAFRETGKTVIAYTQYSGQFQYLAASYADQVFLHPMGSIMLSGLGGDRLYFADMLDKLKVKMHIFRVGEYKSATAMPCQTLPAKTVRISSMAFGQPSPAPLRAIAD
jgi:protease-4